MFEVDEGVLYTIDSSERNRLVVPPLMVPKILALTHSLPVLGHGGIKVLLQRTKKIAYWPTLNQDVERYVWNCTVCSLPEVTV